MLPYYTDRPQLYGLSLRLGVVFSTIEPASEPNADVVVSSNIWPNVTFFSDERKFGTYLGAVAKARGGSRNTEL